MTAAALILAIAHASQPGVINFTLGQLANIVTIASAGTLAVAKLTRLVRAVEGLAASLKTLGETVTDHEGRLKAGGL